MPDSTQLLTARFNPDGFRILFDGFTTIYFMLPFSAVAAGIGFGMITACLVVFYQSRQRGFSSWAILILTVLNLLGLQFWCLDQLVFLNKQLTADFCYVMSDDPTSCMVNVPDALSKFEEALLVLSRLISDGIIIYTASSMYSRRLVSCSLWCLLAITTLLGISSIIPLKNGHEVLALTWCFCSLSVLANTMATALILGRLWLHRSTMKEFLTRNDSRMTCAERILLVVIESGVAFLIFQLIYIIIGVLYTYNLLSVSMLQYGGIVTTTLNITTFLYPGIVFILTRIQVLQEETVKVIKYSSAKERSIGQNQ